jgi:hypothetical protein
MGANGIAPGNEISASGRSGDLGITNWRLGWITNLDGREPAIQVRKGLSVCQYFQPCCTYTTLARPRSTNIWSQFHCPLIFLTLDITLNPRVNGE